MNWKKFFTRLSVFAVIVLVILALLPILVMSMFLGQRYYQYQHNPAGFGIAPYQISLTTYDGLTLAAWHTFASHDENEPPHGTVIVLSGLQEPSITAFFGYASMLANNGWDTLLIEKRARSLSAGDSIGFGISEWLDVKAGVYYLDADPRAGDLPIVTMGTSAGGVAVIIAGGEIPRIDGVIAISAYSNFVDLYVDGIAMMGLPRFLGTLTTPFMHLRMGISFGFSQTRLTPENGIANLGHRPILLMHSTEDWQVPFSHFKRLRQVAEDSDINITTFVREGDWHFVCYDRYIFTPARDVEFTRAILGFLQQFDSQSLRA